MLNIPARSHQVHGGFTLLEILVVLIIMAIGTGMAVFSTGILDSDKDVARETRRLHALLELAQEQAVFQGRTIGLEIEDRGYRFFLYDRRPDDDGNMISLWVPMIDDQIFRPRTLSDDIVVELFVDDRDVLLLASDDDDDEAPVPQIILLSSGDISTFELHFFRTASAVRYRLTGDIVDGLVVKAPGEE